MSLSKTIFKGARVVDPANGVDGILDVAIEGDRIAIVADSIDRTGSEIVDCRGLVLIPGLIDPHVHLRVPGQDWKETITTGTKAAAAGGFTSICTMPNTVPALDHPNILDDLQDALDREALVRVYPIATISKGRNGYEPVDYAALRSAGAVGFSDDGDGTPDAAVMMEALEASRKLNCPVMVHCEEPSLAAGSMHEGEVSRELGIVGIPADAEEMGLSRDLLLAELSGGWLYALHVSTAHGAGLVRQAKERGVNVTAEVMPHHLTMSDAWVMGDRTLLHSDLPAGSLGIEADPLTKVNPPLRSAEDAVGLLDALKSGVVDLVGTDHAPHASHEKTAGQFEAASPGMSGLELALPIMLSMVRAGHLTLSRMVDLMSAAPARILGLPGGRLTPGEMADFAVFDADATWKVGPDTLQTKSANTPLLGMTMRGKVVQTFVDGELRYAA